MNDAALRILGAFLSRWANKIRDKHMQAMPGVEVEDTAILGTPDVLTHLFTANCCYSSQVL